MGLNQRGLVLALVLFGLVGCGAQSALLSQQEIDNFVQKEQAHLLKTANINDKTIVFIQKPNEKVCATFERSKNQEYSQQIHEITTYRTINNPIVVLNTNQFTQGSNSISIYCIAINELAIQQQAQTFTIYTNNGQVQSFATNGESQLIVTIPTSRNTLEYERIEFFDAAGTLLHTAMPANP
ncbi:hypothetical protein [Herpetosiphon giganteus]|uniref:hypothetical protein n=1 Tax=Herpetosiphon giganteus TaxID=2029754 RepID=UPI00195B2577|nr:hypothetical protein [Herpetosiphon giganteus]MBM7842077.1 outer membrane biogenesis lipoprotein LolB [Herpetosiphon giganteus]